MLLVDAAVVSTAAAILTTRTAEPGQQATVAVTAFQKVQQPLWLQDAVRNSKQPGVSSRQTGQDQQPRHLPPSAQSTQTVAAAPYIMLQRAHTVKHTHRVSAGILSKSALKGTTVKISSRGGMRGGVLYRTGTISQGQSTNVTFRYDCIFPRTRHGAAGHCAQACKACTVLHACVQGPMTALT